MPAEATFKPAELVRRFLRTRGGRARLGQVYEHLTSEAISRTMREADRTVEYLVERGELRQEGPELVFIQQPEKRGDQGEAHGRLWRAAHQRSARGGFGSADLARLCQVRQDSAVEWIRQMKSLGCLREVGRTGSRRVYRLAPGAPGPEAPPPFRWPRRGVAKTSKDFPL